MASVLQDPDTAPISPGLRAVLRLLEQMTLLPGDLAGAVGRARALGVSDAALEEAIHVCAMFNAMDRMADALGFDPETASSPERFLAFGYGAMLKKARGVRCGTPVPSGPS